MACNVVQGHFHSKFAIQFWSNPNNLFWSMQAGCLIDDKSMAMAYNKLTLERPIIGTGLIINSMPILEAMPL
jgi:G:T/U-mismatch repair DNA glycosylase